MGTVYTAMALNHCRFCKKAEFGSGVTNNLVKYGPRHYAHPRCYLEAGKTLDALKTYPLIRFPKSVLLEFDLIDEAQRILDSRLRRD